MQSAVSTSVMGMDKFSEEVNRGAKEANQVGAQLAMIIEKIQAVSPRVENATESMHAQSKAAEQIRDSMVQLNDMAHHTVEFLEQSGHVMQHLNEVSQTLLQSVARFRVN